MINSTPIPDSVSPHRVILRMTRSRARKDGGGRKANPPRVRTITTKLTHLCLSLGVTSNNREGTDIINAKSKRNLATIR
jgi:hypothetical protein